MLSNQHVVDNRYSPVAPKTAKTIEAELKDPSSPLAIEVNNALARRRALAKHLEIKELQYVIALQAQEKAEEAENEEAAARQKENQDALLRQSLDEYYAQQRQIAQQAVALGQQPWNAYESLLVTVADYQLKINIVTARLDAVTAQLQVAGANHATAIANWQAARQVFVNSYSNAIYHTPPIPFVAGDSSFSLDLQGLSQQNPQAFQELDRDFTTRFSNRPTPQTARRRATEMHPELETWNLSGSAEKTHRMQDEAMEVAYIMQVVSIAMSLLSDEQQTTMRKEMQTPHASTINLARKLRTRSLRSKGVNQAAQNCEQSSTVLTAADQEQEKLKKEQELLEKYKSKLIFDQRQALEGIANFSATPAQHALGNLAALLLTGSLQLHPAELAPEKTNRRSAMGA